MIRGILEPFFPIAILLLLGYAIACNGTHVKKMAWSAAYEFEILAEHIDSRIKSPEVFARGYRFQRGVYDREVELSFNKD